VVITWVCAGFAAYFALGWDPYLAALFGAIVTVSGPTVVMPLLRAVHPSDSVSSVLRWESILVDPLGAILALLTFDVIIATQANAGFGDVAKTVATIVAVGVVAGGAGGYLFGLAIRNRVIPDLLRDYSALAAVLAVFSVAESMQGESGFLAVTLMGVWLANMRNVDLQDVLSFKESITLLLIGGLFILLAAKLDLQNLMLVGTGAFIVLGVLQFIAGPLRAFVSAIGGTLSWRETLFIGWVFPRGIVAAAVSSLFALRLVDIGYPGAESLVPLVFGVIIGTVVIQSLTTRFVARFLDVAEPERTGVLVVGANPLGRMIAQALKEADRRVLVADSHWVSVRRARMLGLSVFYGSPVSTYAENKLDLTGLGSLLAASRQPGLNELACVRYAEDFGRDHVFVLSNKAETAHAKHNVSGETGGRVLFGGDYSIDDLVTRINGGASIKTTELTSEFGHLEYKSENPDSLILFAIDPNGVLRFPVADERFEPEEGWTVTAIVGGEPQ
jgi:CPA1 family monovalent cation:H+ antiporter